MKTTYLDVLFQLIYSSSKLIVQVFDNIMCCWQVKQYWPWSHGNQAILKCCFSHNSKQLARIRWFGLVSIVSLTWSSTAINWVTAWSRSSQLKSSSPAILPTNTPSVPCFATLPFFTASLSFQIGCGTAQWCLGIFSCLHSPWYCL